MQWRFCPTVTFSKPFHTLICYNSYNDQYKNKQKQNENTSCDTASVYKKKITKCLYVCIYIYTYADTFELEVASVCTLEVGGEGGFSVFKIYM